MKALLGTERRGHCRLRAIWTVTALAFLASAYLPGAAANATVLSLREQADNAGMLIGSGAINPAYLDDPEFAQVLAEQFNSLSPENELKWSFNERQRGVFNFKKLDRLVK